MKLIFAVLRISVYKTRDLRGRYNYVLRIRFLMWTVKWRRALPCHKNIATSQSPFHNRHSTMFNLMNMNLSLRRGKDSALQPRAVARFRFPSGSENLISILGLGVCPVTVLCIVFSLVVALRLCLPHIQGGPLLCICLVFWPIVCWSPYRHLTHGRMSSKSRRV